jgi:predicted component of type VI protein secretion system
LYAIAGLLTNGLRKPEHARFLPHAILFANRRKTASGLEKIISERFNVTAKVEEFQGRWLWVEERDRTKLGNANNQLGQNAMLGGRFWNQSAGFILHIEGLNADKRHQEILDVVRFYVGDEMYCDLVLDMTTHQNQIPCYMDKNKIALFSNNQCIVKNKTVSQN